MTYLIDTHSHFDDRRFQDLHTFQQTHSELADSAVAVGVRHLLITGITQATFQQIIDSRHSLNQHSKLNTHIALGLHPAFVDQHREEHLEILEHHINHDNLIALGEVGLDTYEPWLKQEHVYQQQKSYFIEQLNLAVAYELPVLLHIRKAHGDALNILKQHKYDAHTLGGIAHSFSGGVQEAKAFVKLGFKLGITGQISNPNAKKLRKAISAVVAEYGLDCLVIETDCPDMLPWICQQHQDDDSSSRVNQPSNLIYILDALSDLLAIPKAQLARQLWHNSCEALKQTEHKAWIYPDEL